MRALPNRGAGSIHIRLAQEVEYSWELKESTRQNSQGAVWNLPLIYAVKER